MDCMDIKIGIPSSDGKTFWRTIGTVFVNDETAVIGADNKPATFAIDYPKAQGIIVSRKKREEPNQ